MDLFDAFVWIAVSIFWLSVVLILDPIYPALEHAVNENQHSDTLIFRASKKLKWFDQRTHIFVFLFVLVLMTGHIVMVTISRIELEISVYQHNFLGIMFHGLMMVIFFCTPVAEFVSFFFLVLGNKEKFNPFTVSSVLEVHTGDCFHVVYRLARIVNLLGLIYLLVLSYFKFFY